jgi:hypothetical protein
VPPLPILAVDGGTFGGRCAQFHAGLSVVHHTCYCGPEDAMLGVYETRLYSVRTKHHLLGQLQAFSSSTVGFEVRQLTIN